MPTRISTGVGDHPCFLTFYYYDPYLLQNYYFSLYLFVSLKKDYHNFLACAQVEIPLASTLIFSPLAAL